MARIEDHCAQSMEAFGKPFREVYRWLDEFAGSEEYGFKHRRKRHHAKGIQQAIELFGENTGEVARQHNITHLKEEGWTEKDRFPKDEQDYVKMGLF
jgi:hypothetical protein